MSAAVQFLRSNKGSRVIIIEQAPFGAMASTKNAGFICFGSSAEVLSYIERYSEDQWLELASQSLSGALRMLDTLGKKGTGFRKTKALELFDISEKAPFQRSIDQIEYLNSLFQRIGISERQLAFVDPSHIAHQMSSNWCLGAINIDHEGQIDPARTLASYHKLALNLGLIAKIPLRMSAYEALSEGRILVKLEGDIELETRSLLLATNAFGNGQDKTQISPARGLVMVTSPIRKLGLRTNIHSRGGYIYMRNHENRIMIGGARDLDPETEETLEPGFNDKLEADLLSFLHKCFDPSQIRIDHKWNGYMGFTPSGMPKLEELSPGVFQAGAYNGMGVALSHEIGYKAANVITRTR